MTEMPVNIDLQPFRQDSGTARNGTTLAVPAVPPLYRAERRRDPGMIQPKWLAEKINISRRAARPDTCPKCGTQLLVGPDADQCATTARVDHTPVDHLHEVAALLAGRYSCDLTRGELHHRYPWHTHTANQPHPIHLEHTCTPQTEGRLF